jgi:hypothetical protein
MRMRACVRAGATMESMLLKRMSKVAMSKTLTVAASLGEAAFALLYGMSTSAEMATWCYAGVMMASQSQRAWSNFYEVGGKDVATLGANNSEQTRPLFLLSFFLKFLTTKAIVCKI